MTKKVEGGLMIRSWLQLRFLASYMLFASLLIIGETISPGYLSIGHIISLFTLAAPLGLMAMGETMVMLLGSNDLDISVGDQASFAMILGALLLQSQPLWLVTIIITILGFSFGALNGVGIRLLKIPPLIMTYITAKLLYGLSIAITKGTPSGYAPKILIEISSFPMIDIIWLILTLIITFILIKSIFGRSIYAIGDNPIAAYSSGVPINLISIIVYALSGALSALAGLFLLGIFEIPAQYGLVSGYSLQAIVAVILGGTVAGRGSYIGTIGGVLVLTTLNNFFTIFNIPEAERMVLYGITLALILLFYGRREKLRR